MSLAVQFSEYGTTDVLHVVDVTAPTAGPRQVRLTVRATGVNPADWKIMQGLMRQLVPLTFPAGLGTDVAGVVDQVGSIELAGGPERVLTLAAFDAADTGIRIHVDGPGENLVPALDAILGLIEEGRLQVPISRTYPLSEAPLALDASQSGHVSGKLVLVP